MENAKNMSFRVRVPFCFLIVSSLSIVGCSLFGGKNAPSALLSEDGRFETTTAIEYEDRLRSQVERDLNSARQRENASSAKVIFKKPFYYKEYAEYPSQSGEFTLDFTERESRTTPMAADAQFEKIRFATRLHRKRDEARTDTNFLKDTGAETVSYELRNGKWRRVASLYVADKTEEFVDGEWRDIDESPALPTLEPTEEQRGWLSRLMFWR